MTEAATTYDVPVVLDHRHRRHLLGEEPIVFHCHHYNTFLQRSIQDASYIDSAPFLIGAGAEVADAQLRNLFNDVPDPRDRSRIAERVYSWAGFGRIDLSALSDDGGVVVAPDSHYGSSWLAKFGPADHAIDLFTQGWLAGAAGAIHDAPAGAFVAKQSSCIGTGASESRFAIERGHAPYPTWTSVAAGSLTDHGPKGNPPGAVDYDGIYEAVVGLPLAGDDRGLIPAFGVYLTHQYANYYNRVSFEFERAMRDRFGDDGIEAAKPLLVEAGHVCAFNTFGGIMKSSEWNALIRPSLQTPDHWVHGIVAVVNALGWGRWEVTDVADSGATFILHDDYESVGHLAMYGVSDHPISYLAEGAVAGVMNLVYRGDIAGRPDLTPDFYDHLFKSTASYETTCLSSQASGDATTVLRVSAPR